MLRASGILIELVAEALRWLRLVLRSSESIQAENLFLRRQLALYIERGATPRRIDPATRIANENSSWGEERIANKLLLKIGIRVSPRTVNKYLPRRPRGRPRGDLRWSTFLRLHAQGGALPAISSWP
jgi:hypothetical protein